MKINYCSDTHWDFYVDPSSGINFRKIELIIEKDFSAQDSNTLIIAGDTGHYPKQDALFLTVLKERYKNIGRVTTIWSNLLYLPLVILSHKNEKI